MITLWSRKAWQVRLLELWPAKPNDANFKIQIIKKSALIF